MRIGPTRRLRAALQCKTAAAGMDAGGGRLLMAAQRAAPQERPSVCQRIVFMSRRSSMPYTTAVTTPKSRFANSGPEPRSDANHGNTAVMP